MSNFYRSFEKDGHKGDGFISTPESELIHWNEQGFGIFHTVQEFHCEKRVATNLKSLQFLAVDLDEGTKPDMIAKIKSGVLPSIVVETKRGFHVYFRVTDLCVEEFPILMNLLIEFYNADRNAKDICRVLRTPNFYHWKESNNKFLTKILFENSNSYKMSQIKRYYTKNRPTLQSRTFQNKSKHAAANKADLLKRICNANAEALLLSLSGDPMVGGEIYSFKSTREGNKNIFVNGKSTSCFIDRCGRIGSSSGGGPTIFQWLKWYGHDNHAITKFLKERFANYGFSN